MSRWNWVAVMGLAALLLGGSRPAMAQTILAESHFDANREDWLVKDLGSPNFGSPPVHLNDYLPSYQATGGNPGGHLRFGDPSGNVWYWYAPAAFLGNKSSAYGGALHYQLKVTGGDAPFNQEDLILVGGGLTLVRSNLGVPSSTDFTNYNVSLVEAGWKRNSVSGAAATAADMQTVLGNLSHIYIRGEHRNGTDTGYLDNVVMTSATPAVPEPSSVLLFLPALGVVAMIRRRRAS